MFRTGQTVKTVARQNQYGGEIISPENLDLATVIHELRGPVHATLSFLSVLKQERPGPLNEIQRDFLTTAIHALNRLSRRTEDLRLFVIRADHLPIKKTHVNIIEQVRSCVQESMALAKEYGVSITFRLHTEITDASEAYVLLDPDRIDQVVLNLIENAIRYAEAGSEVTVHMIRSDTGAWGTVIKNTVIGSQVPEDMFDGWNQIKNNSASADRRGKGKGLGLGLLVVDRLVSAHGGVVQSTITGNTVSVGFLLPACETTNQSKFLEGDQWFTERNSGLTGH